MPFPAGTPRWPHPRAPHPCAAAVVDKHPLETKWTLWFDNPEGKQHAAQWGKTLRPVYTFGTVEEFWGCVLEPG